jgi:two-component system, NtrC family, response regulator AtoC
VSVLAILGETENFGEAVEWIRRRGLVVFLATNGEDGLRMHREKGADLVLLGLPLPDMRAAQVIGGIRHQDARSPIIVVGNDAEVGSQLEALELGAQEYVAHPVEGRRDLLFALGVSLGVRKSDAHFRVLRSREAATADWHRIVAGCAPMKEVMRRVRDVCERTLSGATPTVMLTGEIGTGKRLVAKALHYNGARRNRAFGEINCAALAPEELRVQLFGHANGSARYGMLETADGGTMFIDEIGAAPLDVQHDILIAIEDKLIRRAGEEPTHIDVQFVVATRRDLESMTKRGEFRSDLYHRLHVLCIPLPPLRDRDDDILAIADQLLAEIAAEHGLRTPVLADDARAALRRQPWPGNIRELRNEIERLALFVDDDTIRAHHLRTPRNETDIAIVADEELHVMVSGDRCPLEKLEREIIRQALARSSGNVSRAARYLAITRQTLLYRMKKYDFATGAVTGETMEDKT